MSQIKEITRCRICGSSELSPIVHLGNLHLAGVFPKQKGEQVTAGPLELIKCKEDRSRRSCGLVQLRHSYDGHEMYGKNYGYRSGLNASMVAHLKSKVTKILSLVRLERGDLVIDIGSNDSTLLQAYPTRDIVLVGVDPTGDKFRRYYPDRIHLIADFFSSKKIKEVFGGQKAKIITSIAMFYDLEDPLNFMTQVHEVLADDGVWVFEQSYTPTMIARTAYDTICHEHVEYYRLKQIKWMTDNTGFKIIGIEFNDINGGSFSVTAAKAHSSFRAADSLVEKILAQEESQAWANLEPYEAFRNRVYSHKEELKYVLAQARKQRKKVVGYGASTKGNTILQFCEITAEDISCIGEVNEDKYGCYTPGTSIPIVPEQEMRHLKPDYMMVLPWHFRDFFIEKEKKYLIQGGRLLFPLPTVAIVDQTHL